MRSLALTCLLTLGCAHVPDGPAGNPIRVRYATAIAFAVGSHVLAVSGGALLGAADRSSCNRYDCVDYALTESMAGWTLVGLGVVHLVTAGILGAWLLEQPSTGPAAARIQ